MKWSTLRKWLWGISLGSTYFLLILSLILPVALAVLDGSCCPNIRELYHYFNARIDERLNAAIANAARILGTGAALTLLATAADRNVLGAVDARDILRKQYPHLIGSYLVFFVLVFTSSIAGDCNQGAIALFSLTGAILLSIWFFCLSLILLLDSDHQRNMLYTYYSKNVRNERLPLTERMSDLQNAVQLTRSILVCGERLGDVICSALLPYSTPDEESEVAACRDQWEQVKLLEGVDIAAVVWTQLRLPNHGTLPLSPLQFNTICEDVLMTGIWKKSEVSRAILLVGFVDSLLPKDSNGSYIGACQQLTVFCRTLRAKHQGDAWAEHLIGCLACAFGMAMAIAFVDRAAPDWVDAADLDSAWRLFSNNFHSNVFSCVDQPDGREKAELERTLQYIEWSTRRRLGLSWAAYGSDSLYDPDVDIRSQLAQNMTNLYLLERITSQYASQYISYQGDEG